MNRSAVVGLFTIFALIALFGVALVLANAGTAGRYNIGVHFKSAAGLHKGALVYESGVVVGTVVKSELLPNYTVLVTLAINKGVQVPRNSQVVIEIPLTGDSTVEIVPPTHTVAAQTPATLSTAAPEAVPTIRPDDISDPANVIEGTNPATVQDLLQQGQGEIAQLDGMLKELAKREPRLIETLQTTLDNANSLTKQSSTELAQLAGQIHGIASSLQTTLDQNSGNITALTRNLNATLDADRPKLDLLFASLQSTAASLNQTVDTVHKLAADPRVHDNLVETTRGLAATTVGISNIVADIHNVSGNAQTQNQLRDTVANLDASAEKLNSILGSFGGQSNVYGVDKGATPAPAAGASSTPVIPSGTLPSGGKNNPQTPARNFKNDLGALTRNLAAVQIRLSTLSRETTGKIGSPAIARDRGPTSDLNAVILPRGRTSFVLGANDLGGATTANAYAQGQFASGARIGGGVLYGRLGAIGSFASSSGLGFEARAYDLRRPTFDTYLTLQPKPGLQLFGGERDLSRDTRRTVFGVQLQY